MLLHQAVELGPVAVCQAGCVGDVAIGQFEQTDEVVPFKPLFGFRKSEHLHTGRAQGALHQRQGHQGCREQGADLLDHVVELAHVAGPGGCGQGFQRFGREAAQTLVIFAGEFEEEVIGQQRNVFTPLRQRRQRQRHNIETVVKIGAEIAIRHGHVQVTVRGRDHPHVDGYRLA